MKYTLIAILSIIGAFMVWEIIDTSLESNLFEEWDNLSGIPWMEATLVDFYANVFCIFLWVIYKEQSHWRKALWLILLICLGSVATILYLIKELLTLQPGEGAKELLIRKNA